MARNDNRSTALSTDVQPPRLPYPANDAQALGIDVGQWQALTDAIFPAAKTVAGVMLAINYARARKLDVFKRVIHVVPMWSTALGREVETVWPGIGELRTTAFRTGKMAGVDDCVFGPEKRQGFKASRERTKRGRDGERGEKVVDRAECEEMTFPEWAQITVYRMVDGQRCPFVGPKVRFVETFSGQKGLRVPNERWQQAPWQMLEKCAEAAALRRAFPEELGDQWTAEEMEGKNVGEEIEGNFVVLDEEETRQDRTEPRPTRNNQAQERNASQEKAQDEPKGKYGPDIDRELAHILDKIARTEKPEPLAGAREHELMNHSGWPKEARLELRHAFNDRIKALGGIVDDPHDKRPGMTPTEAAAGDEERLSGQFAEAYLVYLRDRVAERLGSVPDLNSFRSSEKAELERLADQERAFADRLFDVAIECAKNGRGEEDFEARLAEIAGAAAAGANSEDERPEEQTNE